MWRLYWRRSGSGLNKCSTKRRVEPTQSRTFYGIKEIPFTLNEQNKYTPCVVLVLALIPFDVNVSSRWLPLFRLFKKKNCNEINMSFKQFFFLNDALSTTSAPPTVLKQSSGVISIVREVCIIYWVWREINLLRTFSTIWCMFCSGDAGD